MVCRSVGGEQPCTEFLRDTIEVGQKPQLEIYVQEGTSFFRAEDDVTMKAEMRGWHRLPPPLRGGTKYLGASIPAARLRRPPANLRGPARAGTNGHAHNSPSLSPLARLPPSFYPTSHFRSRGFPRHAAGTGDGGRGQGTGGGEDEGGGGTDGPSQSERTGGTPHVRAFRQRRCSTRRAGTQRTVITAMTAMT